MGAWKNAFGMGRECFFCNSSNEGSPTDKIGARVEHPRGPNHPPQWRDFLAEVLIHVQSQYDCLRPYQQFDLRPCRQLPHRRRVEIHPRPSEVRQDAILVNVMISRGGRHRHVFAARRIAVAQGRRMQLRRAAAAGAASLEPRRQADVDEA